MQFSKFIVTPTIQRKGYLAEDIDHVNCTCIICANDVKPIIKQKLPRIKSQRQFKLTETEAYNYIIHKLTSIQYTGKVNTPDTFFIQNSSLIYYHKNSKKIKIKSNLTNLEVKKHFEERRKKTTSNVSNTQKIGMSINLCSMQYSTNNSNNLQVSKLKQVAILTYKDGTQQLLTDILLGKMLDKRKNDPFWEDISRIAHIPVQVKHPLHFYKYHYERTQDVVHILEQLMGKMAEEIDSQYLKKQKNGGQIPITIVKQEDALIMEQIMAQQSKIFPTVSTLFMKKNSSKQSNSPRSPRSPSELFRQTSSLGYMSQVSTANIEKYIQAKMKQLSYEIISFFQLMYRVRIFNIKLEYFVDERFLYLAKVTDFISVNLLPFEITMIHDRYEPIEQISLEEIVDLKLQSDELQTKELWKVITSVVNDCLDTRKVELKLKGHHRPSQQKLVKIFLKIFPNFSIEKTFNNQNWKNQLTILVKQVRTKVSKIIREDQGIRILKRFGIQFFRTFN